MPITISSITTLVRYLLGDNLKTQIPGDIFTYENSKIFTISESNASAVTDVLVNDASSAVAYTYSSSRQTVTISSALTIGDTIEVQYSYYPNYSDTEIQDYIHAAVIHLSTNNFYDYTISDDSIFPDPSVNEQRLIAIVTSLLMEPDNKTYRLPDLTINVPRDLPLHDKIRKAILINKINTHGTFDIL
jgi:hypothetical protein